LSTTVLPSTNSRTPSSLVVVKVYSPLAGASTCPVHRALKVSGPMRWSGEPLPQSKFTVASVRESCVPVKFALSK
jgi:hypothetical protein